jgi:NAD(P)-dependent dehydrogenase (short-subunit alcohol dehydrogenase family)
VGSERVKDKVAVITGGGRGFGKADALVLAKEGAHVVIWEVDMEEARRPQQKSEVLEERASPWKRT